MKRILVLTVLIFVFALGVDAKENIYRDMYPADEISSAAGQLPESAKSILEGNGITAENPDWYENISVKNVFEGITDIVKNGFKKPIGAAAIIIAMILFSAFAASFCADEKEETYGYFFAVIIGAYVLTNVFYLINTASAAIKGSATFMLGIVPVFAGVAAMSGTAATAVGASGLILTAAQIIVQLCAFVVVPLMSAYMAVGVSSSVSPLIDGSVADSLKKIATWIIGLVSTLFIGLLSVQTTVSAAADSLRLKTAKFLVGSLVPVAGTALSEAVTTVSGSVNLLKSTVGIYAVFGVCAVLLPVVLEIIAWRIVLWLCSAAAASFSVKKISSVFVSVDSVLAVLLGISAFIGAIFVISLGIVVGVK